MIVDVVLRLHMREALRGEALDAWMREMERNIEAMELVEQAKVAGDVKQLATQIQALLNGAGLGVERQFQV